MGEIGVASSGADDDPEPEPTEESVDEEEEADESVNGVDPAVVEDLQSQIDTMSVRMVEIHQKLQRREKNLEELYAALVEVAMLRGLRWEPEYAVVEEVGDSYETRNLDVGVGEIEIGTAEEEDDEDE